MINEKLEYDLGFYIHLLLRDEPFFAKVSRYLRKVPDKNFPTVGVRLNPDTASFEMAYNPKFFAGLDPTMPVANDSERLAILMHEFYHIVLGHCTERKLDNVPHKKQNIAADWAINSLPNMLGRLPGWVLLPSQEKLPDAQAFEWYIANFPKHLEEKIKQPGEKGDGQFDDHSQWDGPSDMGGEASEAIKQIAESKLKDIIEKVIQETQQEETNGNRAWGSVSSSTQKMIRDMLKVKLDPKRVLGYFIKTSVRADRIHRITKINKRFPLIHPGRAWNRRAKIAISIDQSGSVSDEMLGKFFGWLNEFAKFADFTVIPFDDCVFEDKIYVWKKGEKRIRERVLCGGTNFDAPTDYVNKHDFDGHIICTDLCAPKPKNSKAQRMWVTDRNCASHKYFQTSEITLVVD